MGYKYRSNKQLVLWLIGISKHNYKDNECTPDFSCCGKNLKEPFKARWKTFKIFMKVINCNVKLKV